MEEATILGHTIQSKDTEIRLLKKVVEDVEALKEQEITLEKKISTLTRDNNSKANQIEFMTEDVEGKTKEIKRLKEDNVALKNDISSLNEELEQIKRETNERNTQLQLELEERKIEKG